MKRLGIIVFSVTLVFFLGCGSQEEAPKGKEAVSPGEVKQEIKEAAKATKEYLAQQQEKYFHKMDEKLKDLEEKIAIGKGLRESFFPKQVMPPRREALKGETRQNMLSLQLRQDFPPMKEFKFLSLDERR
jgi:hypothetical protein